jgi:methyl-accepting chemotaxis protein
VQYAYASWRALAGAPAGATTSQDEEVANNLDRKPVLSAHAPVASLGWLLFVETPVEEAYAPIYGSVLRSGLLLLASLVIAVIAGLSLARRMVVPIRALRHGAARIGSGDLGQRISIKTGDELEELGEEFNNMAARLHQTEVARAVKDRVDARYLEGLRRLAKFLEHEVRHQIAQIHTRAWS